MKKEILKLVEEIKGNLKQIDEDGVYHALLDDIYESLALIEDEIYEDELVSEVSNISIGNSYTN
jgi:hypothetical protein